MSLAPRRCSPVNGTGCALAANPFLQNVAVATLAEYAGYQGGSFRLAPRDEAMPIIFNAALTRKSTFWSLEKIISISFGAINHQFKEPFDKFRDLPNLKIKE
jgi:hypothetical protein